MSEEIPRIYAVHLHQTQENARYKDELFWFETRIEALCKIHEIAEDHGYIDFALDEIEVAEKVEIGATVARLLRSTDFEPENIEGSDFAEDADWCVFKLENPHAPDVSSRSVRLLRYVAFSDSDQE